MFLNDEPCMVRPTLIDMNPVEVKYYPFMISLNKCTRICNVLSPKICVPKETNDINVEAFNMITNKDEAKAMAEHISCDRKCKFNSTICNSKQKRNKKTYQCECKNCRKRKNDCTWNPSTCICENSKYLKSVGDTAVTEYDEIVIFINEKDKYYSKKKDKCYKYCFNNTVLLVIILLLIIIIIYYCYAKQKSTIYSGK